MGVSRVALLLLVACSSGTSKVGEDAKHPIKPAGDAPSTADAAPTRPALGDAQIRVEWPKVSSAMRGSPGKTSCNTPRAAFVAPSTTFGIGEAFVIIDGASLPAEAHVRFVDCALSPRVAVGQALIIESAADHPVTVTLRKRGDLDHVETLVAGTPVPIQLPIAGHAVQTTLEAGGVYEVATEDKTPETAWIIGGHAAITDANGVVLVKDLAAGAHAVTAWLPPRAGQPARRATGAVTVVANDLAELTLSLD